MTAYRNILVAVGPPAERSAAVNCATMLALRDHSRLTMLSATGSPPVLIGLVPGLPENPLHALRQERAKRLRSIARSMPPGISVTTRLCEGDPVTALLDELRHGTYDLVVIGSDQHPRWRWRGGLSQALLRRSTVPTLVITPDHTTAVRVLRRTGRSRPERSPGMPNRARKGHGRIHDDVAGVRGHIADEVCRLRDGDDSWLITSEWQNLECFLEWERSEADRELAEPLRDASPAHIR